MKSGGPAVPKSRPNVTGAKKPGSNGGASKDATGMPWPKGTFHNKSEKD